MKNASHRPASLPQVENAVRTRIPTRHGEFMLYFYRSADETKEHLALVLGEVADAVDVPVRVHSECLTGDVFGSLRCDCGDQLDRALQMIGKAGYGVLLYLRQEGRGIGLLRKLQAYNLQDQGLDTVEANLRLGHREDERDYGIAAAILKDLSVHSVRLITNNPRKIEELQHYGIEVTERIAAEVPFHPEREHYLRTKVRKMQHLLSFGTRETGEFLFLEPLLERLRERRSSPAALPFVTLSYAQSLDGSIAFEPSSACSLSSERSLRLTHFLRSQHEGLLVGINTIVADNPRLNVRHCEGDDPRPVILDKALRFPLDARVLEASSKKPLIVTTDEAAAEKIEALTRAGAEVLITHKDADGMVDLRATLALLHQHGLHTLMVEGGGAVINCFLRAELVDYCVITVSPKLIGGFKAVSELCRPMDQSPLEIRDCHYHVLENDMIVHGCVNRA